MKDTVEENVKTVSEGWLKKEGAADVLDTIANLSNDEVFTPPKIARQVLDLLPKHVWSDSSLKFLDPCAKSGVFLREITKRLMAGLRDEIPDETARREHILRNQVYGIAITELTALMSRRTLYCSSNATREMNPEYPENCFSAVKFDRPEGNIIFPKVDHNWDKKAVDGSPATQAKCLVCGASAKDFIGMSREGMENHAYPFIHMSIEEIFGEDMKFDVIVGNPPYQMNDGGGKGSNAYPIYQDFVYAAEKINPRIMSFIIPSRWMTEGRGLDEFRNWMLNSKNISKVVDYIDENTVFPGVSVNGGVMYFTWESKYDGFWNYTFIDKYGEAHLSERDPRADDVFVRGKISHMILQKIDRTKNFGDVVLPYGPYGGPQDDHFSDHRVEYFEGSIKFLGNSTKIKNGGKFGYVPDSRIKKNRETFDFFKVVISKANGAAVKSGKIYGEPIILPPGVICSETYLVIDTFENEREAEICSGFLKTKFCRFLVSLRKFTQNTTRGSFKFVPYIEMKDVWTDEQLYSHFELTQEEIDHIESTIKEMP